MYKDNITNSYFHFYILGCYGNHSCAIRCYCEKGRVAAYKGLFTVINNNKLDWSLDIPTKDMLKK